jgi:hypothetical protein
MTRSSPLASIQPSITGSTATNEHDTAKPTQSTSADEHGEAKSTQTSSTQSTVTKEQGKVELEPLVSSQALPHVHKWVWSKRYELSLATASQPRGNLLVNKTPNHCNATSRFGTHSGSRRPARACSDRRRRSPLLARPARHTRTKTGL